MLAILAQIVLCSSIGFQYVSPASTSPSGLILDIKQPFEAFKKKNITKNEFSLALSSGRDTNKLEYKFVYDFGHWSNKPAVRDLLWEVTRAINDSLDTESPIQLIFSFEIVSAKLGEASANISAVWNESYYFPNILLSIVLEPDRGEVKYEGKSWIRMLTLQHIRQILGISKNQNLSLGLLYSEEHYLHEGLKETDVTFVLFTPDISEPLELEDTFHYFQTEVKPKREFSKLEMIYYLSNKDSTYKIQGIDSDVPGVCLVILNDAIAIKQRQKFSVIPRLSSNKLNPYESYTWSSMLPIALEAAAQGFNTLLLNHHQWQQLEFREILDLFKRYKPTAAATPLQIIIDYSGESTSATNISVLETDWKNMAMFLYSHGVMQVKALVFKIAGKESLGYEVDLSSLRTRIEDLASKPKIGCSIENYSFKNINASKIVSACKHIGGSLYILRLLVTLEWNLKRITEDDDALFRSNYLYMLLHPVRELQNEILKLHDDATVYIHVDVLGVNQVYEDEEFVMPVNKEVLSHSLFCHHGLRYVYQTLVSIITWANGYNFPLILNSALSHDIDVHEADGEWLSFLRKVPRINREFQVQKKRLDEKPAYAFPVGHNEYYKTDSCIDWIEEKPEISMEYFNNNNIGTIFHTDDVHHNGTALENVLTMMFQFVCHRFRLIEIVISANFSDVLAAFAFLSKSATNSTVFINFNWNPNSLESSIFVEFLEKLENSTMPLIKGIHLDLSQFLVLTVEEHDKNKHKIEQCLLLQSLFKKRIVEKKLTRLKFGILVSSEKLFELIQYSTIPAEFSEKFLLFLNQTKYVVFYQKVDFKTAELNKKSYQERMFNEHLTYKRIIQSLFPHLEVYFRLELDTELKSDYKSLKKYLTLLSHAKAFSMANSFGYFIVEAFNSRIKRKNGWWEIKGDDPANPKSYIEKEAEFSRRPMWYPDPVTQNEDLFVPSQTSPWLIVGLSVAFLLFLIAVILGVVITVCYRKLRQYMSNEEFNQFLNGKTTSDTTSGVSAAESMKFDSRFQLHQSDISFDTTKILGMGNFGTVFKGVAKGKPAAIKQPEKDCPKSTFRSMLTEIKVLCYIGVHPNVLEFIGAYTKEIQQGILFIATEYCSNGSLENLLRKKRFVISEMDASRYQHSQLENLLYFNDLHRYAMEIANGLDYIESKNVVHGDLAARNILLDEHLTCKIGDFGLSRKLYEYQIYIKKSQEPIPWKWMAFESLTKMEFTSKSDVWSYGVTLWEIYSLGEVPYADCNWTSEFTDKLRNGFRLPIAQFSSQDIYEKQLKCWDLNSEKRPTFANLVQFFKKLGEDTRTKVLEEPDYIN